MQLAVSKRFGKPNSNKWRIQDEGVCVLFQVGQSDTLYFRFNCLVKAGGLVTHFIFSEGITFLSDRVEGRNLLNKGLTYERRVPLC